MKKSQNTVRLYAICAIIWIMTVIISIVKKTYNDSMSIFVMNVLCAVAWIIAFITESKMNKSNRKVS